MHPNFTPVQSKPDPTEYVQRGVTPTLSSNDEELKGMESPEEEIKVIESKIDEYINLQKKLLQQQDTEQAQQLTSMIEQWQKQLERVAAKLKENTTPEQNRRSTDSEKLGDGADSSYEDSPLPTLQKVRSRSNDDVMPKSSSWVSSTKHKDSDRGRRKHMSFLESQRTKSEDAIKDKSDEKTRVRAHTDSVLGTITLDSLLASPRSSGDFTKILTAPLHIAVLGGECGKSCLVQQFLHGKFETDLGVDSTVEDHYETKFKLGGAECEMKIMDCGNAFYAVYHTRWIGWGEGFMLCFGVDDRQSFEEVHKFCDDILRVRQNKLTPFLIVGTKVDVGEKRQVTKDEGENLADHYRGKYIETSAINNQNVAEAFKTLAEEILKLRAHKMNEKALDEFKTGWVKMRKGSKAWKKRFVVLTKTGLRYYDKRPNNLNDTSAIKGTIPFRDLKLAGDPEESSSGSSSGGRRRSGSVSRAPTISKVSQTKFLSMYLTTPYGQSYELRLGDLAEKSEWHEMISQYIQQANAEAKCNEDTPKEAASEQRRKDSEPLNVDLKDAVSTAIRKFNAKPSHGVEYMILTKHLTNEPAAVAAFLQTEGLSKKKVGEYLGDPKNEKVLAAFLEGFDFVGKGFDDALREFLSKFRLPGEAQAIDRIVEKFAHRFCTCNTNDFDSPDTAYILGFSLIMLNTDAHNPSVKKKMTKQQFIANNRGIDNGKNLSEGYLGSLYDSIVKNEIQMDYERDDMHSWELQGYLQVHITEHKMIKSLTKHYNRRWCIVTGNCLFIFDQPQDQSPSLIVPLLNLEVSCEDYTQATPIKIYNGKKGYIKAARDGKEKKVDEILLLTDSGSLKFKWVLALQVKHDFRSSVAHLTKSV